MTEWLWLLIGLFAGAVATWLLARRINAANADRIDALSAAADKATKSADKLRRENEATKDAAADAKRLRGELDAMRARLAEATAPLQARIDALEADVARRERQIADFKEEVDEREHRIAELRARLGTADVSGEPSRLDELTAELARAEARATEHESRMSAEHKRAEDAAARLARETADSLKHQARILELKDAVDHLTRRFADRNRELEASQRTVAERDESIRALRAADRGTAPAAPLDEKAANAKLVEAYRHDMAQRDRKIADLERALAKVQRRSAAPAPASERPATPPADRAPAERKAQAEPADQPTPAPAAAPKADDRTARAKPAAKGAAPTTAAVDGAAPADDLTRIKGIGKVFATRLHDAGIRTFDALAASDAARLEAIVEPKAWQALDFGAWSAQARELGG